MTTRFTSRPKSRFGVLPLPSGYDPSSSTGDITVSACGVEDVDRAVFNLFEKEIPLVTFVENNVTKRVPVIFAARERWKMMNPVNGVMDKNGSLILPLLTIVRENIQQMMDDIAHRGANQHVGELVVQRRLSSRDRGYQNIINRQNVRNQQNVATTLQQSQVTGQPLTLATTGDLTLDPTVSQGGALVGDRQNNIVETFVVPTPQKIVVQYRLTIWAQHQQQANAMIEACVSSYLPQMRGWRVETSAGYGFNAFVTSDEFSSKGNATDLSRDERIIKYEFTLEVPCFVLASASPGLPVHVKRYVSAPIVKFDVGANVGGDLISSDVIEEPFLGSDDPTLPLSEGRSRRRDMRKTGHGRVYQPKDAVSPDDPALLSIRRRNSLGRWNRRRVLASDGRTRSSYVRVKSTSPGGETVTSGDFTLGGVSIIVDE